MSAFCKLEGSAESCMSIKAEPELDVPMECGQCEGPAATCISLGIVIKEEQDESLSRNIYLSKSEPEDNSNFSEVVIKNEEKDITEKVYSSITGFSTSEAEHLPSCNMVDTGKPCGSVKREIHPLKENLPVEPAKSTILSCPDTTQVHSILNNHITSKHADKHCSLSNHINKKPRFCPYCEYRAARTQQLRRHVMYKHTNDKPHSCPHCEYKAVEHEQLRRHIMAKHTNEKPHSCPHCNYSAVRSQHLKLHIRRNHTARKSYSCPHCDYSAVRSQYLKLHITRNHTKDIPGS